MYIENFYIPLLTQFSNNLSDSDFPCCAQAIKARLLYKLVLFTLLCDVPAMLQMFSTWDGDKWQWDKRFLYTSGNTGDPSLEQISKTSQ